MRIFLISTFTLAIYAGQADAQPPAEDVRPAATQEDRASAPPSQTRNHARAAQRMARARHASLATGDNDAPASTGLPLSETVVSQAPAAPDPDR
ncbi:hypothetical protein [Maricaulis sp.]|uniref:hypothetical protein n=1 Tax=Maricaulis sp. TaxID=1486257 RepID=UPI0025B9EAD6|nr:hypothetical protein [Maricaulis sp.]